MEGSQAQQLSNLSMRPSEMQRQLGIYMILLTSTSIFIIYPSFHCHKSSKKQKKLLTTYKMSYTKANHNASYPAISASNPANSAAGKVVLITGAGSGIGQAAATSFAPAGAKALILIGRRTEPLTKTAAIISQKGPDVQVRLHGADISDVKTLKSFMAETVSTFGQMGIVIHAAGVLLGLGPISTMPVEELWKALEVKIKGTLNVAQPLLAIGTSEKSADLKKRYCNNGQFQAACCTKDTQRIKLYTLYELGAFSKCDDQASYPAQSGDQSMKTLLASSSIGIGGAEVCKKLLRGGRMVASGEHKLCCNTSNKKMTFSDCEWYSNTGSGPAISREDFCAANCPNDRVRVAMDLRAPWCSGGGKERCCIPNYYETVEVENEKPGVWRDSLKVRY
ncbi:hypothetical protein CTAM01_11119 [Colletotrichum tamarilloi]|uniref:Ketoreductase domain-containing protein n=1 Tax=Colletotrichum tamarilloi TaxID=1209934 RepID=A0ABQ9QYQ3_9PEZI|nr:uncharacterized protein CTAM01_11119 [Colletotrichum tamarilloi]KAK1489680.1 hypothetical protein CTAM01_11119 [Colletotrichum tamarilloi]